VIQRQRNPSLIEKRPRNEMRRRLAFSSRRFPPIDSRASPALSDSKRSTRRYSPYSRTTIRELHSVVSECSVLRGKYQPLQRYSANFSVILMNMKVSRIRFGHFEVASRLELFEISNQAKFLIRIRYSKATKSWIILVPSSNVASHVSDFFNPIISSAPIASEYSCLPLLMPSFFKRPFTRRTRAVTRAETAGLSGRGYFAKFSK
jgi:hypothetical protein